MMMAPKKFSHTLIVRKTCATRTLSTSNNKNDKQTNFARRQPRALRAEIPQIDSPPPHRRFAPVGAKAALLSILTCSAKFPRLWRAIIQIVHRPS